MRRTPGKPRYIEPASVQVGDTITVSYWLNDIGYTATGLVSTIYDYKDYDELVTAQGQVLVTRFAYGVCSPASAKLILVSRENKVETPVLF